MIPYLSHRIAPHNPGRAGRIAAWLVLCALILGAVGFMLGLMLTIGRAHEATDVAGQPLGWVYGYECCSGVDCSVSGDNAISEMPEGYRVELTGEIIPYGDKRIKRSRDEFFHRCTPGGIATAPRSICLYVPDRGF
jgi:hypothetical protein